MLPAAFMRRQPHSRACSLTPPDSSMSLSTNGATALAADAGGRKELHVQKLSLQRIDVNVGHPRAVRCNGKLCAVSRTHEFCRS